MLVPSSYRYSSSPPKEVQVLDEKRGVARRSLSNSAVVVRKAPAAATPPPATPPRSQTTAIQSTTTTTRPMAVPQPPATRTRAPSSTHSLPSRNRNIPPRRTSTPHDPNALPPAVAALLAMTAIPPPRPGQFRTRRRQSREQRRVSIDELVNDWKSDDASYSGSPALSILLEDGSDNEEDQMDVGSEEGTPRSSYTPRSSSSESVPSLERDDRSVLSSFGMSSPRTPPDLAGRRTSSTGNLKGSLRGRSHSLLEEASLDHPLASPPSSSASEEAHLLLTPPSRSSTPKPQSTFTSNLTLSLQRLKSAVTLPTLRLATAPSQRPTTTSRFSDATLWSHPYLFPRLTAEIRPPTISGTPSEAQRRYLNPNPSNPQTKMKPLTFEDQEVPFQLALHAPYLAEEIAEMPTIPMQTYSGRRSSSKRKPPPQTSHHRSVPDPNSEAGRALAAPHLVAAGVRQREPRENSDFLRVVVLEMNMRREGKLEAGRARIWLPPRRGEGAGVLVVGGEGGRGEVPRRWRGVSAY